MCTRYVLNCKQDEFEKRYHHLLKEMNYPKLSFWGDQYPQRQILYIGQDKLSFAVWGVNVDFLDRPIVNARLEKLDRPSYFFEAFKSYRVCVPATSFYEWHHSGDRRTKWEIFTDQKIFSIAGLLIQREDWEIVLLTKASAGAMQKIHHRMPALIPEEHEKDYLFNQDERKVWQKLIETDMPLHPVRREPEQLSLFK